MIKVTLGLLSNTSAIFYAVPVQRKPPLAPLHLKEGHTISMYVSFLLQKKVILFLNALRTLSEIFKV